MKRHAILFVLLLVPALLAGADPPRSAATMEDVLAGLRSFYAKTTCPDGSFQPGIDPGGTSMARLVLPQALGNAPHT